MKWDMSEWDIVRWDMAEWDIVKRYMSEWDIVKWDMDESCVCIAGFLTCGCQKKSVVYETECRHAAVQRGKQVQNHL